MDDPAAFNVCMSSNWKGPSEGTINTVFLLVAVAGMGSVLLTGIVWPLLVCTGLMMFRVAAKEDRTKPMSERIFPALMGVGNICTALVLAFRPPFALALGGLGPLAALLTYLSYVNYKRDRCAQ